MLNIIINALLDFCLTNVINYIMTYLYFLYLFGDSAYFEILNCAVSIVLFNESYNFFLGFKLILIFYSENFIYAHHAF